MLIQAQRGQFARGEIQVEGFVLLADGHDLAAIGHVANAGAYLFDVIAQLAHGKSIAGKGEDGAVHITEFIVEPRALNALGEIAANVADFFPHLVPDMRDGIRFSGVFEEHKHRRFARSRVALHVVERVQFFELFLDAISDLQACFIDRGARPFSLDHHGFDGEGRVLCAP